MPVPSPSTDKVQELSDRVRQYEGKLATLTVINGALQTENDDLRAELESAREPTTDAEMELLELREEFARRIATADKTNAALKDKIEAIKAQAAAASQGGSVSHARLQERESYIISLQAEGEGLARKNGELEATARKLRSALREAEQESERQQARMAAIEGQLAQQHERSSFAGQAASSQIEELEAEVRGVRREWAEDIASVRREAARVTAQAQARADQGSTVASAAAAEREEALAASLQDQRAAFQDAESRWLQREEAMRREVALLEEGLRALELDKADAMAASADSTRPLIKQIEAMAAAASAQHAAYAEAELQLVHKLREAESAATRAADAQQAAMARTASAESAVKVAQSAAVQSAGTISELRRQLDAQQHSLGTAQAAVKTGAQRLEYARVQHAEEKAGLEGHLREVQEQLWEAEEKTRALLAEKQPLIRHSSQTESANGNAPAASHSKGPPAQQPVLPVSRSCLHMPDSPLVQNGLSYLPRQDSSSALSLADSARESHEVHAGEDEFDGLLRVLTSKSSGQNGRIDTASMAALRKRTALAESAAEAARAELSSAAQRAESAQLDAERYQSLHQAFQDQEAKLHMALELLGERNERIDQLEDDIRDMKHIFHTQLSSLVDQLATQ